MSYITPRVQIQQEFEQLPVYSQRALSAFVIGPNYHLARYDVDAEKYTTAPTLLNGVAKDYGNAYQYLSDEPYDIPNVPVGGDVDPAYTKVYVEDAIACYFPHTDLGNVASQDKVELIASQVAGKYITNRVRFTNLVLTTTPGGDNNKRSAQLSNRDVAVGDYIDISGGSGSVKLARITALIADVVAADIKNDAAGADNVQTYDAAHGAPTHTAGTGSVAGGSPTSVTAGYAYYGHAKTGVYKDKYTIKVTSAPVSGLAGAKFSITSENNVFPIREDQVLDVDDILTLDSSDEGVGTNSVQIDFTGVTALVQNTVWTVSVATHVTAAAITPAGTYTNALSTVYTMKVTRGGLLYDGTSNSATCAEITITGSEADTLSVVQPQLSTPFNVGTFGVTATITAGSIVDDGNHALLAGNVYRIEVVASKAGPVKTVELTDAVTTTELLAAKENLTAKLYLKQAVVNVPAVRNKLTSTYNWTQSADKITIKQGLTTYDSLLLSGIVPARLPVVKADLYVEHRDILQTHVNAIDYVESPADVLNKLGTIDPDNQLAQGAYDAVLNSAGERVYFLAVNTDDLAGYLAALKIAEKSDKVYSFVPLTFDREVQDAVVGHVNAYSTPEIGRWRIAWLSIKDDQTSVTYSSKPDGSSWKATVTDNLQVLGVQYTYVTVAGADFLADDGLGATKLRPNDVMRINFTVNADSELVYDEYVVDKVLTNEIFTITSPLPAEIPSAVKVELCRSYTKAERAHNIAEIGGSYNNRRVRAVFPDTYQDSKGVSKPGYIAAAGLAGLRSGVVPHQGLTNSEFLGAYNLSKTVIEFQQAELDTMAAAGIWIITQSVIGATPYVRHQLTTDESSLNTSEDSITTNVDSISYALRDVLAPFIGRYNINKDNLALLRAAIFSELNYRATGTSTYRAGNQLASFRGDDILSLDVDPVSKDKINASVKLHLPYPLNYVTLKLIGGA